MYHIDVDEVCHSPITVYENTFCSKRTRSVVREHILWPSRHRHPLRRMHNYIYIYIHAYIHRALAPVKEKPVIRILHTP